jgi:hypothetical protein
MPPSFTLSEVFALGGQCTWRLKDGEIRYRGSGDHERLVIQRIPASPKQIETFASALELLDVVSWLPEYSDYDAGWETEDGSAWTFTAKIGNVACHTGGSNAFPSFESPTKASIQRERFALLVSALYDAFEINAYVVLARRIRERRAQTDDEQSIEPKPTAQSG